MIITIYKDNGEKISFFDIKEFTVAGPMQIVGTEDVEYSQNGFHFKDNQEVDHVGRGWGIS